MGREQSFNLKETVTNMFSHKDRVDLNNWGVEQWFQKYAEFLSCFRVEGEGGLKERMAAFYRTENFGEDELQTLAENSLGEKEVQRIIRTNPDADLPDYDRIYMAAVSRIASQAFLQLQERGILQKIQIVEEIPALAQAQYDQLVLEARPIQSSAQPSAADLKNAEAVRLKQFADAYYKTPSYDLSPKGGKVKLAGQLIPLAAFNDLLSKASAAGLVRG
jgi:hypothetical protein